MDFEARNFGIGELPAKEVRYDRADEVVEACCALWDCWQDDALVMDKESGLFIDPGEGAVCRLRGALCAHARAVDDTALSARAAGADAGGFARRAVAILPRAGPRRSSIRRAARRTRLNSMRTSRGGWLGFGRVAGGLRALHLDDGGAGRDRVDRSGEGGIPVSLVPLEMVLATNSAMLGADLSMTKDEDELTRNKGHQGHGGLEDRIRQTMRAEGISFAEAIRRPRNLWSGRRR